MRKTKLKCPCCSLSGKADLFEPEWPIAFSDILHSVQGSCAEKDVYLMTWQEKRGLFNHLLRHREENAKQD